MTNTAFSTTRRRMAIWGVTLIVATATTISAIGANVMHRRAEAERLRADVKLIDAATAQLAYR